MNEECKNCKYLIRLYVPPIDAYADIPKDAFVCTLFLGEGQVQYIDDDTGMCECFTERKE